MVRGPLLLERAYKGVRRHLLHSKALPGHKLSRHQLAKELDVSLSCIRVALDRLEGEGLVESLPQSGTRLREVDAQEYLELHDLRELMECYAVRRAAQWITPAQIKVLDKACGDFELAVAACEASVAETVPQQIIAKAMKAEHEFHGTIMRAARNANAVRVVENFRLITQMAYYASILPRAVHVVGWRQGAVEHRAIARALANRDADAAEHFMREHMGHGRMLAPESRTERRTRNPR